MSERQQIAHRWEPVPDIPEPPAYDFSAESSGAGRLTLTLKYSLVAGNDARDMRIVFGDVIAFRTYWDGDTPAVGGVSVPPWCFEGPCKGVTWSLLYAENSQWLVSGDFAACGVRPGRAAMASVQRHHYAARHRHHRAWSYLHNVASCSRRLGVLKFRLGPKAATRCVR